MVLPVAIKKIDLAKLNESHQEPDDAMVEVNVLREVRSPYVMRLFDYRLEKTNLYLICEYVDGNVLSDFYESDLLLTENSAKIYAHKILTGINHLHSKKVIHRDIKLENILYVKTQDNQLESIKIVDLGMATYIDDFVQGACGTPYYIPPEVLKRQNYTEKFDVWSTGIIIFTLLFGRFPFEGKNMTQLAISILNSEVYYENDEDLSDVGKDFLSMIFQKDPKKRASCQDLLNHPWLDTVDNDSRQINFVSKNEKKVNDILTYKRNNKLYKGIKMFISRFENNNRNILNLKKAFLSYDKEKKGSLTLTQFKECLIGIGLLFDNQEYSDLFNSFNMEQNGLIDYDEFISGLVDNRNMVDFLYVDWMFKHIDKDSKGYIMREDVEKFLADNKIKFEKVDICSIFDEIDVTNTGKIEEIDFNQWIASTSQNRMENSSAFLCN